MMLNDVAENKYSGKRHTSCDWKNYKMLLKCLRTPPMVICYPQIFKKEVFCISSKGFNQRDAYRVMLRKYPDVMNIEQMCDALRISTKTGYKLLHEGKIPAMKIGRSYRIPKAHLFTYLQICGQHCRAENRQC